jgi:hypothetical protein
VSQVGFALWQFGLDPLSPGWVSSVLTPKQYHMNSINYSRTIRFLFGAALLVGFSTGAFAQATRTWVSGVGDDANPCSRTAPCKTFAGAISKTAAAGEISALDPGGFGAITITKSITINGTGTLAGILSALVTGVIVNAGVNDTVIIRDVSINGAGNGLNGVRYLAGKALTLDHVWIYGFNSATGRGVDMNMTSAGSLRVIDSRIQNIAEDGIRVNTTGGLAEAAIINSHIMDCGGDGIEVLANARVGAFGTRIFHSTGNGVNVTGAGSATNLDDCFISNNAIGIRNANSSTRVSDSIIANNSTGLSVVAGTIDSFQGNSLIGNSVPGAFSTTTQKQ